MGAETGLEYVLWRGNVGRIRRPRGLTWIAHNVGSFELQNVTS